MSGVGALWDVASSSILYASTARLAGLLAFAAVGEWVAEKAGTLNISIESMMLTGAFGAALGSDLSDNVVVALAFGLFAGLAVAWVQANLSHRLAANQFVVGLTLNVLAVGLTAYLNAQLKPDVHRVGVWRVPVLARIPLVGEALFAQSWLLYLLYPLVPALWWLVYRTRWGLEVRSVGENPQAADVSGIHVNRRRRQAVCVAGLCAGLSGSFLTLGLVGKFGADGVSGRGFIAIAAVIFGGWTLRGTVIGACVFGLFDALRLALPALGHPVNTQLLNALPYVMTLATMLVLARRGRQPGALARPFARGLT